MPLQFTCPYCQTSQMIPDQAPGQTFACAHCRKVVKVALASPALAVPVATPVAAPVPVRHRKSSAGLYVVAGVCVATMVTGISLAIFYRPGRQATPPANAQANADKLTSEKETVNAASPKKIDEPPLEPEPEPDVEPPAPLLARRMSEWYVDGDAKKVRLDFNSLDPAATIKELKVIVWTGEVAAPKPASWRSPRVRRGDDPRQEVAVPFKDGRGSVEVTLPPLPKDKMYWLQPTLVDGAGKQQWLAVEPWEPSAPPLERRPALLVHKIEAGERKTQLSSQASVTVRDRTGQPIVLQIGVHADVVETIKPDAVAGLLQVKNARVRFDFTQDDVPVFVEKLLGPALAAAPKINSTWRLDPAGTVSKRVVNLDDVPAGVRKEVSEFDERLAQAFDLLSLHFPNRELQALESWTHQRPWHKSTLELTATYEGRRDHQGRDEAYLSLRGKVAGAGKHKDGKVEGMALVDLKNGLVMKAELKVETEIVVPFSSREEVRGPGLLEVRLEREPAK